MILEKIKIQMEKGKPVRRTDWQYPEETYIVLEATSLGEKNFYMYNKPGMDKGLPLLWAMSYQDVNSRNWHSASSNLVLPKHRLPKS